jgi:hypothetical protein
MEQLTGNLVQGIILGAEKPPEVKPKPLEDIRKEDEAMAAAIEQVCKTA